MITQRHVAREAVVGGGIILDPRGQTVKTFAWGLGHKTNNEAEWIALLRGLDFSDIRAIPRLLVFGDSCHVILKMITDYSTGSIKCRRLYDIISHLPLPVSIDFFHILRANNAQADALANIGASFPQGHISIKNLKPFLKPIP